MTNLDYEVGQIRSQVNAIQKSVDELAETVEELTKTVSSVDKQINNWRSTAVGAITVIVPILSAVGAVVLWISDSIFDLIKIKLGL